MRPSTRRRPSALAIAALVVVATLVAAVLAELVLRLLTPPSRVLGQLTYELEDGAPITFVEACARGLIVRVPPPTPRARLMFAPNQTFFLRYSDNEVLRRDWFDERGRVKNHINGFGLRERDDVQPTNKAPGERRIVCLGDSFTFGWGVPEESGWVRGLEGELRRTGTNVRTVNCGASGTVCIDEYWNGLRQRFHVFQPDAVVLTICLNDLLPSSGLTLLGPSPATGVRLVDLVLGALGRSNLDLDPRRDWVGELLALRREEAIGALLATERGTNERPSTDDKPFESMWSQGVPQKCLREAKAWCDARSIPFLVTIWPFLQGLGPGRFYPFQKIHDLVAADCAEAGIPLLDVLPALRGTNCEDLWVTPADQHANPLAHRLALPSIAAFVRAHTKW